MPTPLHRSAIGLIIIFAAINLFSCNAKPSNAAETRIRGKWEQTRATGTMSSIDVKVEYEFLSGNEFKMAGKVGNQVLTKNDGDYKIENDSLFLYYGGDPKTVGFSAKILFQSETKMSFFSDGDETEFDKVSTQ